MSEAPLEQEAQAQEEETQSGQRIPWVTYALAVVCVGIWAGIQASGDPGSRDVMRRFGSVRAWDIWRGAYWALLTSAFVHVKFWHLAFNVYWLWVLGQPIS